MMDEKDVENFFADIGGVNEIAETLGVSTWRVKRWIDRREATNCPKPRRKLAGINIYSMADWHGWFALWRITRGSETWKRKKKSQP